MPRSPQPIRVARDLEPAGALVLRLGLALAGVAPLVLRLGWPEGSAPISAAVATLWTLVSLGLYALLVVVWPALAPGGPRRSLADALAAEKVAGGIVALGFLLAFWGASGLAALALAAHVIVHSYNRALNAGRSPSLVFVGSFALLILVGAGALSLPAATPPDKPLSLVDALFTSTSAVCVTGLIVRDTATEFTRTGQGIILALIQLGGLGIVLFAAFLALVMGSSLSVRTTHSLRSAAVHGAQGARAMGRLVMFVVAFIIAAEAIGALTLFLGWPERFPAPELGAGDRAFHSLFFAVSAFCNAGFATTTDSLHALRSHWTTHIVMAGLIVAGGIGFPVIVNLRDVLRARLKRTRLKEGSLVRLRLHTRLVLWTTLLVYLAGGIGIFVGRLLQRDVDWGQALLDAHFASITARTAGFDTVAPADMGPLSRFVLVFQMFIGGSPGSTAGGVKTIVLSVMLLTVWATMLGRSSTQAFGRTVAEAVIRQAAALIVLGLASVTVVTSVLVATDGARHSLEELLFEAISASGTVGLSLGATPDLSSPGKLAVIFGMFVGRVGPLAVAVALVEVARRRRAPYAYPTEDVLIS